MKVLRVLPFMVKAIEDELDYASHRGQKAIRWGLQGREMLRMSRDLP